MPLAGSSGFELRRPRRLSGEVDGVVDLAGIITNPTGAWTAQAARNLTMTYSKAIKFVIRDGAGQ